MTKELFSDTKTMQTTEVIVIPVFNESPTFDMAAYQNFLMDTNNVSVIFVNDGSSDDSLDKLSFIQRQFPHKTEVLDLKKNVGKAEAVRFGMLHGLGNFKQIQSIAYLDADLATSLFECRQIMQQISPAVMFAFGSRILNLNSVIQRNFFRFMVGRIIATLISKQLDLSIYDTQCGCKAFHPTLASTLFQQQFISRWLFDVELFHRLIKIYGRQSLSLKGREVPLKYWRDGQHSSVQYSYFLQLWLDLYKIARYYK